MSFPRYPTYKESGVEWLGEVPEHWGLTALKHGYEVTLGKMLQPEASSEDDILLPYLRAANIHWSGVDHSDIKTMWFSIRDREHLLLQVGDLLVSEGGDVGRSAIWQGEISECYFQNSVNRVRPSNGNLTSFLCYWISTMKDKGFIDVLCNKSTIAHFTAEKVGAVPVPIPPVDEQQAIAHFLSQEIAKIDALIVEQQHLIELLLEKRQAVISHAVTKGLNPDALMKDSGVEWLGEVPEHWEIAQIRRNIQKDRKITYGIVQPGEPDPAGRYMIRGQDYSTGWAEESTIFRVSPAVEEPYARSRVRAGDLVMTIVGAGVGNTARIPDWLDGANLTQTTCRIAIDEKCMFPDYARLVLDSWIGRQSVRFYAKGAAQPGLNLEHVKAFLITCPPLAEQHQIATHLEGAVNNFSELIRDNEAAIVLLQERRSALISAAVTGQIDVRGLVPEVAAP